MQFPVSSMMVPPSNPFTYYMPQYRPASGQAEVAPATMPHPVSNTSSTVLLASDYNHDNMTDFLSNMACSIVQTSSPAPPAFQKFLSQILGATQLPSSSILLGLSYLSSYASRSPITPSPSSVYRLVVGALLLANKFLDDNTFTNKSWGEISGFPLSEIMTLEREWLTVIGWNLHIPCDGHKGWKVWSDAWITWDKRLTREREMPRLSMPVPSIPRYKQEQHPYYIYDYSQPSSPAASIASYYYVDGYDYESYSGGQFCQCEYCQIPPSFAVAA